MWYTYATLAIIPKSVSTPSTITMLVTPFLEDDCAPIDGTAVVMREVEEVEEVVKELARHDTPATLF